MAHQLRMVVLTDELPAECATIRVDWLLRIEGISQRFEHGVQQFLVAVACKMAGALIANEDVGRCGDEDRKHLRLQRLKLSLAITFILATRLEELLECKKGAQRPDKAVVWRLELGEEGDAQIDEGHDEAGERRPGRAGDGEGVQNTAKDAATRDAQEAVHVGDDGGAGSTRGGDQDRGCGSYACAVGLHEARDANVPDESTAEESHEAADHIAMVRVQAGNGLDPVDGGLHDAHSLHPAPREDVLGQHLHVICVTAQREGEKVLLDRVLCEHVRLVDLFAALLEVFFEGLLCQSNDFHATLQLFHVLVQLVRIYLRGVAADGQATGAVQQVSGAGAQVQHRR
mmetsp:Transcript_28418/g.50791  ORF Transcript_28418/g.50791 Transcript_28418/m.50791 type:complete len:343 (-) Transcript_28418:1470-2498(-)